MSIKVQFTLLFILGLASGVVIESHVLRPLSQPANTTAGATGQIASSVSASTSANPRPAPAIVDSTDSSRNVSQSSIAQSSSPAIFIAGTPKISVKNPTFNFGSRDSGEVIEHTFTLTNNGDGTLLIDKVKTNCGCTVAQLSTQSIPPGETAEVKVKLNLHRLKGRQNRIALVQSNDPSAPNLKLAMVGNAVYHVTLSPQHVAFGQVEGNEPSSKVFKVEVDETVAAFEILSTRTSGENVKAEVEVIEPGKKFAVNVTVTPQSGVANLTGWVQLVTDHPGEYKTIGIPISAFFPSSEGDDAEVAASSPQSVRPYSLTAEIGEELEIGGTTLDGDPIDLIDYRGKPTLVVFWASDCDACKQEMTLLKGLYEDYHEKGFEIVGVSMDGSVEQRQEYLEQAKLPWPNLVAKGEETGRPIAIRYKVRLIPSVTLLDREGKIIAIDKRGESLRKAVLEVLEPGTEKGT